MRTDFHFREFLELDTQIPSTVIYTPMKVTELHDLTLGARDFVYVREENLMIVAMSDMNITSRIDAYLTNVGIVRIIMIIDILSLGKGSNSDRQLRKCRGY